MDFTETDMQRGAAANTTNETPVVASRVRTAAGVAAGVGQAAVTYVLLRSRTTAVRMTAPKMATAIV